MLDSIIPNACPALGTGPRTSQAGVQGAYIARTGCLPPHWSDQERLEFECARDDNVLIVYRPLTTPSARNTARQWLRRHGLDDIGRPLIWETTGPQPLAPTG